MTEVEDDDDQFLSLIDAAEAAAIAGRCKRQKLSDASGSSAPQEIQEGSYMAALRGSRSSLWQRRQQDLGLTQKKGGRGIGFSAGGNITAPPSTGAAGACFKCGVIGHWARDCDGGQGGSAGQRDESVAEKLCPCGSGKCLVLTANTAKNPGRRFYCCPLKQETGGCNFFEWCDNQSHGVSPSIVSSIYQANLSIPDLQCPCDAGSCIILASKSKKFVGQNYYRCPANEGLVFLLCFSCMPCISILSNAQDQS